MGKVKRPALKFYGGKWRIAPWIIEHFPPHTHYVEPCFGAGSVLMRKEASELETVNDIDGRLVNFFRVLRDRPDDLIRVVGLTPWAKQEYDLSKIESNNELEDARRFFAMSWMSINGAPFPTGFRASKRRSSRGSIPPKDLVYNSLVDVASRIKLVQIFNLDAIRFIRKFSSDDNQLTYFDPPYPSPLRVGRFYGKHDDFDDSHSEAAELLRKSKGYVVVSGYQCAEYKKLYEDHGWARVDKINYAQYNKKRVESIWLSPATVDALG